MKISAWSVVKNEAQFIGYGLMSILNHIDEVVYFDGNSTDGTLRLLDYIKGKYDTQNKIKVYQDKDFSNFKEEYVRVFNECMKACTGDYLWYVHPDMILTDPGKLVDRANWKSKAFYVNMRSFGGEDMELEIVAGRTNKWKTIMKNAFGLEYWGVYGHPHEDMYFKHITGNQHVVHKDMTMYPFKVEDSGIKISHFCECKPLARREQKMETVLRTVEGETNQALINRILSIHPRVTLQDNDTSFGAFRFIPRADPLPEVFAKHREEFEAVLK